MISHFQWSPLYNNNLPGWKVSFFYKGKKYTTIYHKDGRIEWPNEGGPESSKEKIEEQIQELMLYHIYDS